MIGDTVDDATAASAVGCNCVLIDSGHGHVDALAATGAPIIETLLDAVGIATNSDKR